MGASVLIRTKSIPGIASIHVWWRPVALIASVAVAYAMPLSTLFRAMGSDTPIAYLGLVPPIAFALGCWHYYRADAVPASPTMRDVMGGGILLVLAALIGIGLPVVVRSPIRSQHFDLATFLQFAANAHLDLLSLPIFAAGILVLLYGLAALRWASPAIGYGFLVWPVPYIFLLGHFLPVVLDATVRLVNRLSAALPLGATSDPGDGTLFTIATPHGPQTVSIGSACSGFNSFVAWLLFGAAICLVMRERRRGGGMLHRTARLIFWLLIGAIATFLCNIARITLLFAAVHRSGLDGTFGWMHALLGNGLFALVVLGMLGLLVPLGLAFPQPIRATRDPSSSASVPSSAQASLLAFAALALATGMFLDVSALRLVLMVLAVFLLCCFALLALFARAYATEHQLSRPRAIILVTVAAAAATVTFALFWHLKHARAEQLPSIGWRIDMGQQALVTGPARRIVAVVCAIGAIAAGRCAVITLRRRADAAHRKGSGLVPVWGGPVLVAAAIIAATITLDIATVTVASFRGGPANEVALMADFDAALPNLPDAERSFVEAYDWPRQSLGATATYNRYQYSWSAERPLWVDVVTTQDADALAYHDVRSCYAFHGFIDRGTGTIPLGNSGETAWIINYIKPDVNEAWSTLYWEQRITRGSRTFYQRIVLLYYLDGDASNLQFGPNNARMASYATRLRDGLATQ
jgi:exosortase/archaeosortase family protein